MPNARINPPEHNPASAKFTMKAMLIPVGFNELLDFVRHDHFAFPDLSRFIVSFTAPAAAGRFI